MSLGRAMPKYTCHKEVQALKIKEINIIEPDDSDDDDVVYANIVPAEEGYNAFKVGAAYLDKHKPYVGGYYVRYKDGYESFSPAKEFEEGYALKADQLTEPALVANVSLTNSPPTPLFSVKKSEVFKDRLLTFWRALKYAVTGKPEHLCLAGNIDMSFTEAGGTLSMFAKYEDRNWEHYTVTIDVPTRKVTGYLDSVKMQ